MAGRLIPLKVTAPGFFGMNTQQSVAGDIRWASEAMNCVIDKRGRIASRKGRLTVTTSALAGSPAIQSMFEQVDDDGTLTIISAANNKLYSGTTALTERTGTAGAGTGITANHWQFQMCAGKLVGFQDAHDPIVRTTGNFSLLQADISDWAATTTYAVGDVVKALSGANKTLYFHCTTAGDSGGSQPTWNTTEGATTSDGTVTWTTRVMPNGNICHSAFGRIWVTRDGDDSTIYFSDTLLPHKFSGGAAGTLDLTTVWGGDKLVAISSVEDLIVFFGEQTTVVYQTPDDPSNMSIFDKISGIGCIARDSVQSNGKDLVWLSDSGVRTLQRTLQGGKQPIGDLSKNVRDAMMDELTTDATANIKSVYHEPEGFYILAATGLGEPREWVFDLRFPLDDGSLRATRWRSFNAKSFCSSRDREMYVGSAGVVARYSGYNDGTSDTYDMVYRSTWVDFTGAQVPFNVTGYFKIPKRWITSFITLGSYTPTFVWGFDYKEALHSTAAKLILTSGVSEWNQDEWGIGEWSGGDVFAETRHAPTGHGEVLKVGFNVVVNAFEISAQSIDLAVKLGRLR